MKKIAFDVIVVCYIIMSIFVTICLLSFNDYRISEFGNTSFVITQDKLGKFDRGNLVVVSRNDLQDIKKGQEVLFYNNYKSKVTIQIAEVKDFEKISKTETTLVFGDDRYISSEYVLGTVEGAKEYPVIGKILGVLESKWGYLIIVILPILFAFVYEIYAITVEIKKRKNNK